MHTGNLHKRYISFWFPTSNFSWDSFHFSVTFSLCIDSDVFHLCLSSLSPSIPSRTRSLHSQSLPFLFPAALSQCHSHGKASDFHWKVTATNPPMAALKCNSWSFWETNNLKPSFSCSVAWQLVSSLVFFCLKYGSRHSNSSDKKSSPTLFWLQMQQPFGWTLNMAMFYYVLPAGIF